MSERRVIAIQQGARRNYAYARQLEAAGLLAYLATDAAWPAGSRSASMLSRLSPQLASAVSRRTVTDIPAKRIVASFLPYAASLAGSGSRHERLFELRDELLAFRLRLAGLRRADIIVNYFGNGGSFLEHAKKQGVKIITDFISSPDLRQIERRAAREWPGWGDTNVPDEELQIYRRRFERLVRLSDIYLCPSSAVAEGLRDLPGFDHSRVRVVPYGAGGAVTRTPASRRGQVLFVGSGLARKGLPYLAEAARILKNSETQVEIRVAGEVSQETRERTETRALNFRGHLDKSTLAEEYARADLFCLPSLSEGSATSVYEALAHRLPVVTTLQTGSVVRDGIEGRLVPLRNGPAIASAIREIVADRTVRDRMSIAAGEAAVRYGDAECARLFLAVVKECLSGLPR